jgi:predicted MPP superfamily phosphohydrolase
MSHETRVALMLGVALLAFFALARYLLGHVAEAFRWKLTSRRSFYLFVVGTAVCAVLPRFFAPLLGGAGPVLGMFATLTVLGMLVSGTLLAPYAIGRGLWRGLGMLRRRLRGEAPADEPADPSRRAFVHQAAVGGALSVGLGATAYGTLVGRHDYELVTCPIRLAKLPRALDGFSIVQLSDLHAGSFVSEYEFQCGLELVRRARPDLIVLTGDLIDYDLRYVAQLGRFARALGELAPRGVYAVMGNHDHYTGVDRVEGALTAAGAQLLTNRHVRIADGPHAFVLAGLDDVVGRGPGRGPDLASTFAGAPHDLARVLLSHNPGYFPTSYPHADLTLSGHTHGGQITLFINPAELVLRHGLVRGHYLRGESQIYVNRGFGTAGPPTRVGSRPEVTKLVLTV